MKNNNCELPDDLNPVYLFSTIETELLVKAVNGEINLLELADKELSNRGLDKNGKWVGFKKK